MNIKYLSRDSFAGLAAGAVALVTVAMLCPLQSLGANAVGEGNPTGDEYGIDPQAAGDSALSVSFSPTEGSVVLEPTSKEGTLTSIGTTATVNVKNSGGYRIYIGGESSDLVGKTTNRVIPGVGSATAFGSMPANTWGYHATTTGATINETTEYKSLPVGQGDYIDANNSNLILNETKYVKISFAARINTDMPADVYQTKAMLTVVSNPMKVATFGGITYMQEMTPEICAAAEVNDTRRLIDSRDNTAYWVAKLRDNNCWMTQNLDLVLTPAGLSAADSDINELAAGTEQTGWNANTTYNVPEGQTTGTPNACDGKACKPTQTMLPGTGVGGAGIVMEGEANTNFPTAGNTTQTNTFSWDQGYWVYNHPTNTTSCGSQTQGIKACEYITINGTPVLSFVDVSGKAENGQNYTAAPDPDFTSLSQYTVNGVEYTKNAGDAVDTINGFYDAHYLIGNYYQWNAATAGSGGTIVNADASSSICPRGWGLPTSGDSAGEDGTGWKARSFGNLLRNYGLTSTVSSTAGTANILNGSAGNFTIGAGEFNIATNPLFFVRSGHLNGNSSLGIFGGNLWSSTASETNQRSCYFSLGITTELLQQTNRRYFAFSLRCLAY